MPLNHTLITLFEILYLLTVVSIVVVVITENRNPIKTVAWVLAVLFLPVIGIIWYAIFGQDTTRRHVISRRMYSKLKKRPLDEMETPVEQELPGGIRQPGGPAPPHGLQPAAGRQRGRAPHPRLPQVRTPL